MALGFGVVVALIVSEVMLRCIPNGFFVPNRLEYILDYNDGSLSHVPNQRARMWGDCFDINNIATNSRGMRLNRELGQEKSKYRIAVLGDSFMEALQVSDKEHFSSLLQNYLIDSEVMNFGVASLGTVTEYVAYLKRVREFKPDLVILTLFTGNDVINNSYSLENLMGPAVPVRPFAAKRGENYEIVYQTAELAIKRDNDNNKFFQIHEKLRKSCGIYNVYLKVAHHKISKLFHFQELIKYLQSKDTHRAQRFAIHYGVYHAPADPLWQEAWAITEYFILLLKQSVEHDGGKFIVVILVDTYEIDPHSMTRVKQQFNLNLPPDLDVTYPQRRIKAFADKHNIYCLPLLSTFRDYRENFRLLYPYFSYRCDRHWNPLGHFLAANRCLQFLVEEKILTPALMKEPAPLLARLKENLQKAPEQILGKKAWEAVYHGGTYQGDSLAATW